MDYWPTRVLVAVAVSLVELLLIALSEFLGRPDLATVGFLVVGVSVLIQIVWSLISRRREASLDRGTPRQ